MDNYPPSAQRPALLKLASALDSREAALRRDDYGDWRINGKFGHVLAAPLDRTGLRGGFQLFVSRPSARSWAMAKKALAFAKLTNDGDEEGAFILNRLPTEDEAETIRKVLGIFRRRKVSADMIQRLRKTPPRGEATLAAACG